MTSQNDSKLKQYELVQIPTTKNVTIMVEAENLEEVRSWALENVDTSTRWIVRHNGRNIAEAIVVDLYRCHGSETPSKTTFNSMAKMRNYFATPEEAAADYRSHKAEAKKRLDAIEQRLNALCEELAFDIDYVMDGDTHGIYEDYLYISVDISGYSYKREYDGTASLKQEPETMAPGMQGP